MPARQPPDASGQPLIKPASAPQPESAFFKLVKGGLRAVDGLIGQTTPQNYGVETPVATIGVRGTAFDVRYCGDDCIDESRCHWHAGERSVHLGERGLHRRQERQRRNRHPGRPFRLREEP